MSFYYKYLKYKKKYINLKKSYIGDNVTTKIDYKSSNIEDKINDDRYLLWYEYNSTKPNVKTTYKQNNDVYSIYMKDDITWVEDTKYIERFYFTIRRIMYRSFL